MNYIKRPLFKKLTALERFNKGESLINIGEITAKDVERNHKNVEAVLTQIAQCSQT